MRRRWPVLLTALALTLAVGLLALPSPRQPVPGASAPASRPTGPRPDGAPAGAGAPSPGSAAPLAGPAPGEQQRLATFLQERYGARLGTPSVQVRVLEKLLRFFRERFPTQWEAELRAFLRAAFPERAEALLVNLSRWLEYERWMAENEGILQQLGAEERRANVWEERRRLWGEEAARDIWAAELRHQAVAEALAAIDARTEAALPERLAEYRERLAAIYGEQAAAYLAQHRQEALNHFLDLGSVQRELAAMAPPERARSLRDIRAGLGLDTGALARWEVLDRARDDRWEAGARYMAEREALAQQHSGSRLERRLAELRQRSFGAEAETIAAEEESGFFRYHQPRVWGRN